VKLDGPAVFAELADIRFQLESLEQENATFLRARTHSADWHPRPGFPKSHRTEGF
jgi:hypothetical protein